MKDTNKKTSFFPNHKMLFCEEDIYLEAQAIVAHELFDLPKAFLNSANDNLSPIKSSFSTNKKMLLCLMGALSVLTLIWMFG